MRPREGKLLASSYRRARSHMRAAAVRLGLHSGEVRPALFRQRIEILGDEGPRHQERRQHGAPKGKAC
jgi:hypothetical protein